MYPQASHRALITVPLDDKVIHVIAPSSSVRLPRPICTLLILIGRVALHQPAVLPLLPSFQALPEPQTITKSLSSFAQPFAWFLLILLTCEDNMKHHEKMLFLSDFFLC